MRSTKLRRRGAGLAGALAAFLAVPWEPASADGNETLGSPQGLAIAQGSGIVTAGTGLITQPGVIDIDVPAGATVKQVLLYWNGYHTTPAGDGTVAVGGNAVAGSLIGGPDYFFPNFDASPPTDVRSSTFRADITALGLIGPGANAVAVSGLDNDFRNNGAGVVVVIDDGTGTADIQIRDGDDNAFSGFPSSEPRHDTVPQTFTIAPATVSRSAVVSLNAASVDAGRGNTIDITVGGVTTTVVDALGNVDGAEWDTHDVAVTIPAGVTSVTVKLRSTSDGAQQAASMTWVSTTLAVAPAIDPCSAPSTTTAVSHGSAFSLDATLLGLHPLNQVGKVATVAPGAPASQARQLGSPGVAGVVSTGLLTTQSNSSLSPSTSTSSSTVADVNLLNGLVRATTVRAVSQSVASTSGASYNSQGSVIQGLRVNNADVAVAPNKTVAVKNPLLPSQVIAELRIFDDSGTSTYAGGTSASSHSVTMLRLVVLRPFLGLPAGVTVTVAQAQSDARSPITTCPGLSSVSGEAFTVMANGTVGGQNLAAVKVGDAVLPVTGGTDSDGANAALPGAATSATAANTTSGALLPAPNATARSRIEGANVIGTVVTADLIDVSSTSSATGAAAGTTLTATFANLKVGGVTVSANVAPNTVRVVQLPLGAYAAVTLNEQTVNTNGATDTVGTVNAIHVRVFAAGGGLTAEVIVGSASSGAHAS